MRHTQIARTQHLAAAVPGPGRAGASYCSRTDHCNSRTKRRHGQKNYHLAINWGKHLEQQQQQPQEQEQQAKLQQMQH
ncbi:hypothetical protein AWZ03_008575 [Drosophila navojoa]|uniref:Uncharacterized protein n=1 Tax=Drosophila navojoa TaxID=7232 RepID=A0A484B8N6_DRONA|nr:hypothetical protein AWZ03_008575 [Drosophila navojoa]